MLKWWAMNGSIVNSRTGVLLGSIGVERASLALLSSQPAGEKIGAIRQRD